MKYILIILIAISCSQTNPVENPFNFRESFRFVPDTSKGADSSTYIIISASSFMRLDTTQGVAYKKYKYELNDGFSLAYFVRKIDSVYGIMIQMPQCEMLGGWQCAVAHYSTKDTAVTFKFVLESDSTKAIDSVYNFVPRSMIHP